MKILQKIKDADWWGGILLFLAINFVVTMCSAQLHEQYSSNEKRMAVHNYYTSKVCSLRPCDAGMAYECEEYCYDKEVGNGK